MFVFDISFWHLSAIILFKKLPVGCLNFVILNQILKMALNPAYDAIGKGFVQQYYALFDDPITRQQLGNMYNVSTP